MKEIQFQIPQQILLYASGTEDEIVFHENDLIQVTPYGINLAEGVHRPFLILKDKAQSLSLPVAINPLEAGIILSYLNRTTPESSPHSFLAQYLKLSQVTLLRAVFVQIKGTHQYVRIYLQGLPQVNSIKVRADEAMSLCIYFNIPIFSTIDFINASKVMSVEMEKSMKMMQITPEIHKKTTHYLN